MNLMHQLQKDKPTIVATYALAREAARNAGFTLKNSIAATCLSADINRTQVYEKKSKIENDLSLVEQRGPGRPAEKKEATNNGCSNGQLRLEIDVLKYRLAHPGSLVRHSPFRTSYSNSFKRFSLGLLDGWQGKISEFSDASGVPLKTLAGWQSEDGQSLEGGEHSKKPLPKWPVEPNETCRLIVADYIGWDGNTREFLKHEASKLNITFSMILSVLRIAKMISSKKKPLPRHRGSTTKLSPGSMVVTDGKSVVLEMTSSGETSSYCWQGTVDQTTVCHTAVVITANECASGVEEAYKQTVAFLGKPPIGFLHDNKPIHDDKNLRQTIERETMMIPATLGRPENKAVIEGEFGKFEQQVGTIKLDDSSMESLKMSAVSEVIRAYTAAINHAGRFEFNGKSRQEELRRACPDPEKDKKLIKELKASHDEKKPAAPLPTWPVSRKLLDAGYEQFDLTTSDPTGKTRQWLAERYEPDAIIQAIATFGTKTATGALKGAMTHRYLIKVIQGCQDEITLRAEEDLLRKYTAIAGTSWHDQLEEELNALKEQNSKENLATVLAEHALFGGIMMERSFWEVELRTLIREDHSLSEKACRHVRRIYEAEKNDRFQLISKIISWEHEQDNGTTTR